MSDPFYDVLFPPIPLDEAAEAFLNLKQAGHRVSDEDDRLLAGAIKTAAEDQRDRQLSNARVVATVPSGLGRGLGGVAGGFAGLNAGQHAAEHLRTGGVGSAALMAGGLGLGVLGGRVVGHHMGKSVEDEDKIRGIDRELQARETARHRFVPDEKTAVARMKVAYQLLKRADEGEAEVGGTAIAPPSPPLAPDAEPFMAAEQAGRAVEEQSASQYYAERLRAKAEELGLMQQQLQEVQQSSESMSQQLATMQETQGVADQATQAAKQMALENAQQANAAAEQAMAQTQQAMADSTQAKLQLQQMRATLLELAGQDPGIAGMGSPGAVPGAGQGAPGTPVMGAPGGAPQDPAAQQPGAAGGQDPSASPAGGTGASSSPGSGAAEPSQESSGGASPSTQQAGGSTAGSTDASKVQVKVGGTMGSLGKAVRAAEVADRGSAASRIGTGLGALVAGGAAAHEIKKVYKKPQEKIAAHPALVGGLLGGAAGAGLAGMEAAGHGPDPAAQQEKIDRLEQGSHEPGLGGFAKSFELAKERALQTLGTATREHPALAMAAGGLMGAGAGASAGPHLAKGLSEAAGYYRGGGKAAGHVAGLLGG